MQGLLDTDFAAATTRARAVAESDQLRALRGADAEGAANAFERLLSTMLVAEMRKSVPEGLFGSGPGQDVFESWFDEHVGAALADGRGLELAGMLKASIHRMEEAATPAEIPE